MNPEPVSLVPAIVVATIGGLLFVGLFGWMFVELRRKRRLREKTPELDVDDDIRRYVDRVFLLVEVWRPRLDAETRASVDALWQRALDEVEALQDARNEDGDASERIAELIDLEAEIERVIGGG